MLGNLGGAHRSITEEVLFKKPKFKFPLGLVNTCQVQAASMRNAGLKTWGLSDLVNPDFPLKSHLKMNKCAKMYQQMLVLYSTMKCNVFTVKAVLSQTPYSDIWLISTYKDKCGQLKLSILFIYFIK